MSDTIGYPDPGLDLSDGFKPHTSHWGVFSARLGQAGLEVRAYAGDPDPNGIIDNFPGALRHQARIAQPAIRRGWLERGPGPDDRRGRDEFVSVSWEQALDLLGDELMRIRDTRGQDMEMHPRLVDVEELRTLGETETGEDAQLKKAVSTLLEQLK